MQFGVGCSPGESARQAVETARLAEELGFDVFWVADSHIIWRELYALLGAIAVSTSRIEIGPGVTHPFVRHPSVTASAIATLQELAPGRVRLGLGVGDSGPANLGLRKASLKELEHTVLGVRRLLSGEAMDGRKLGYTPSEPAPIYVAAASNRTHAMGGRVADGALVGGPPDELPGTIQVIRDAERAADRRGPTVKIAVWTCVSIDADRDAARQAVRPVVARKALNSLGILERHGQLDEVDREPLERLRREWDSMQHMADRYARLVEDRWVERFAFADTPAQVAARCEQAIADGADEISAIFKDPASPRIDQQLVRFADAVISPLRAKT
ncbi:MAG TPA: LLM class flavin-dependent oxidoreductase [Chloroflexota bacterium]|nr:LLM class flavin-dependent oxidoreductase [Chloroflexota bacterium]